MNATETGKPASTSTTSHFGAAAASYETWDYAGTGAEALEQLETQLDIWLTGVKNLGESELREPVGAKEPYPELPMADLVLHIHRELIHHLSEVALLRDLYIHTKSVDSQTYS
ncbi:DinB family protein [Rhodococcus qingshengii]|uniref:DinB family protein n=1 Tax=Rhodococcus qingshengii TaxID=334542 RepID=UPI001B3C0CC3